MSDTPLRTALADLGVRDPDATEILARGRDVPAAQFTVLGVVFATALAMLIGGRVLRYVRNDALCELRRGSLDLISCQPGAQWLDGLGGPFKTAEDVVGPISHFLLIPVCAIAFTYLFYVIIRRFPEVERRLTASQIIQSVSILAPGSSDLSVLRFFVRGGYRLNPEAPLLVSMNDVGRRLSLALLIVAGLPLCALVGLDDRAYTLVTEAGVERVTWNRPGVVHRDWSELRALDLVCTEADHGSMSVVLLGDFGDPDAVTLWRGWGKAWAPQYATFGPMHHDAPVTSFLTLRERFAPNVPLRGSTDEVCDQNLAAGVERGDETFRTLAALLTPGGP